MGVYATFVALAARVRRFMLGGRRSAMNGLAHYTVCELLFPANVYESVAISAVTLKHPRPAFFTVS